MSDRWPVFQWRDGEAIPDLRQVPEAEWVAAVTPLSPFGRHIALARLQPAATLEAYGRLLAALPPAGARRTAARALVHEGEALPAGGTRDVPGARSRQISMRLTADEYADLTEAGRIAGSTRTQLARLLVVSGARRVLREHS